MHCARALGCHSSPFQAWILWLCGCQASELDIKRDEVGATSALAMKGNWFAMFARNAGIQKYVVKMLLLKSQILINLLANDFKLNATNRKICTYVYANVKYV